MVDFTDAPEVIQSYLAYKGAVQNRSKNTIFQYYHDLRSMFRYTLKKRYPDKYKNIDYSEIKFSDATDQDILSVTSKEIYDYLLYIHSKDLKGTSRARKLCALRSLYKYLLKNALIKADPTRNIESPKLNKALPKFLTLDESVALLNSISGKNKIRDFAIITIFLNCGLRVSELCGINISDIDSEITSLHVTGKGNKERVVYLNDACRNAIKEYLKIRPKDAKYDDKDALFISRNRNRISVQTVQWLIYKHLKSADLGSKHMSVHKLRHTAATLMYTYGKTDVRILKDVLGHENIATTEIYTHVNNEQMKNAIEDNPLNNMGSKIKQPSSEISLAKKNNNDSDE